MTAKMESVMLESEQRAKEKVSSKRQPGGILTAAAISATLLLAQTTQAASFTVYESNEIGTGTVGVLDPDLVSFHNITGPVLADDFVAASSGTVSSVTWWGSGASVDDEWEITFHANSSANDPAYPLISQHFVTGIVGTDANTDGVWEFTANWIPQDTFLTSGTQYWFSVANGDNALWQWALAGPGGPQVGSENFFALESVGGDPSLVIGPHDGPWKLPDDGSKPIQADLAFKISAVPIPAAAPLFASALALFGFMGWRKKQQATA